MLPGKPWGFQSGEAPQLAQYLQEKKSLVSKPKTSCRDVVLMLQGKRTSHPLGKLLPPLPAAAEGSPSHPHWQSRAGLPFSPSGVSPNQCPQGHWGSSVWLGSSTISSVTRPSKLGQSFPCVPPINHRTRPARSVGERIGHTLARLSPKDLWLVEVSDLTE